MRKEGPYHDKPFSYVMGNDIPWSMNSPGSKVHGAHLGTTGPRWAPCWPRELCNLGRLVVFYFGYITVLGSKLHGCRCHFVYSLFLHLLQFVYMYPKSGAREHETLRYTFRKSLAALPKFTLLRIWSFLSLGYIYDIFMEFISLGT